MRAKIMKCTDPETWYKDMVGQEVNIAYVHLPANRNEWPPLFIVKDHNWYWNRRRCKAISSADCDIVDDSGSTLQDGYEIGLAQGKEMKLREMIAEGMVDDPDNEVDPEVVFGL